MKYFYLALIILFLFPHNLWAQRSAVDSIHVRLKAARVDSDKINAFIDLGNYYYFSFPDSAIFFGQRAYELAAKDDLTGKKVLAFNMLANAYAEMGDYANAFRYYGHALQAYTAMHDLYGMSKENNNMGDTYRQQGDYVKALRHLRTANDQIRRFLQTHGSTSLTNNIRDIIIGNLGEVFLALHQPDSAERYLAIAAKLDQHDDFSDLLGPNQRDWGEVQAARHHKEAALVHFREAIRLEKKVGDGDGMSIAYLSMANLYHQFKMQDSAEYYAQRSLNTAITGKYQQDVLNAGQALYSYYQEDHNIPKAFEYFKLATAARDSIYSQDKIRQLLNLDFEEKRRQEDIKNAQLQYRYKIQTYLFLAGLIIAVLIILIIWRNARQRKAANRLLQQQKEEIEETLSKLKTTQNQLVQSEKMASLGELTAGIAHEIQNPLNFVNNFSEVSVELLQELKEEAQAGRTADVLAIAEDLTQNLEKITHHGKRADVIVKGMLEHSRAGKGRKEPADLNQLAGEYLRLAYHGLRAKYKDFQAELITHFDESLTPVNVVSQDIGRVLLNLYNNAFYAIQQRQNIAEPGYKPVIEVSSFKTASGGWGLRVCDNGIGVPESIKEKIMQPFFTTKPTGQGTGLGLSLSYDIIVKGHSGNIELESTEGQGSVFTLIFPNQ